MDVPPEDFRDLYASLPQTQLLELAQGYDQLIESAQTALRAEFANRHLEPPLLEARDEAQTQGRRLVTVRRYRDLSEAIVARSFLESAGIVVYLFDENLVRLDWQVSNFIGGIRLKVAAEDEASAVELLNEPIPERIAFEGGCDFPQPHCPVCASIDITFEGASRGAAIASVFLLGLPLPLGEESWLCNHCGARWQEDAAPAPERS